MGRCILLLMSGILALLAGEPDWCAVTDPALSKPLGEGVRTQVVGEALQVRFGAEGTGLRLRLPEGRQDWSERIGIVLDVRNTGERTATLHAVVNDRPWIDTCAVVAPGATVPLTILLRREQCPEQWAAWFPGMNGKPGGHVGLWSVADPARIERIDLTIMEGSAEAQIEVRHVRALGRYAPPTDSAMRGPFLPFVDRFGQYRHADWPGKVAADRDLVRQRDEERADLAAHPAPAEWDEYGGWKAGPRLAATGHFRTQRHEGRWWLVDPAGRLFWSHGIDCIWSNENTPLNQRDTWFAELLPAFRRNDHYDLAGANLWRKFGENWRTEAEALTIQRLASWGLNTIGNWSDPALRAKRRLPYVVDIHYGGPKAARGFPDVRQPGFRVALRERLERERGVSATDPWCIGYFIDNELTWPDQDRAAIAEAYYRTCREELKRVAPDTLYLGSRLHGHEMPFGASEEVARAAASYCDVVGVNRYRFTAADLRLPEGCDKPIIIGEFHWGALDRGLLHPGLRSVADQAQRGAVYRHFLTTALRHPNVVGAHWFQFRDQPVTGRDDGENYQCGFVDICDRPYPETIAASRAVGAQLYRIRSGKAPAWSDPPRR